LRYLVIDMERELVIEAGVPTADIVAGDSEGGNEVLDAVLPGGRYVTTTYTGSYDELVDVTTQFLQWATDHDLTWDAQDTEAGEAWGCRLELFLTNPAEQPDPSQNVTQLAFRLADG
ncbi:MAG: AraC family transcriptional regulator, partial [Ilumatobacteraceae bacterium]|nr:AraC family transcriptional regulator [Ilumatobacteraceae bacterium]